MYWVRWRGRNSIIWQIAIRWRPLRLIFHLHLKKSEWATINWAWSHRLIAHGVHGGRRNSNTNTEGVCVEGGGSRSCHGGAVEAPRLMQQTAATCGKPTRTVPFAPSSTCICLKRVNGWPEIGHGATTWFHARHARWKMRWSELPNRSARGA